MKVLIIYCHPSKNSFTYEVKEAFILDSPVAEDVLFEQKKINEADAIAFIYDCNRNDQIGEDVALDQAMSATEMTRQAKDVALSQAMSATEIARQAKTLH